MKRKAKKNWKKLRRGVSRKIMISVYQSGIATGEREPRVR